MGMFDYIRCQYPLPAGAPTDGYQTKDTEPQYLETLTIREDGTLVGADGVEVPFHGALNFYTSNVSSSGPRGYLTVDNKPAEFWDFVALYDHGKLVRMDGGREEPPDSFKGPPVSRAEFWGKAP